MRRWRANPLVILDALGFVPLLRDGAQALFLFVAQDPRLRDTTSRRSSRVQSTASVPAPGAPRRAALESGTVRGG